MPLFDKYYDIFLCSHKMSKSLTPYKDLILAFNFIIL